MAKVVDIEGLEEALLNEDSPDFSQEEADSAINTADVDDMRDKVVDHLRKQALAGVTGRIEYQRRRWKGVDYQRVVMGTSKAVFKIAWLRR